MSMTTMSLWNSTNDKLNNHIVASWTTSIAIVVHCDC